MPKNSIHGEAVSAFASEQELREASVDVGVSIHVFDDPTSQECNALLLGVRLTLDPAYKAQFDELGVDVTSLASAEYVESGAAVAKLIIARRDHTKNDGGGQVSGLSRLGDLNTPPSSIAEAVEADREGNFCTHCQVIGHSDDECDDEYDEDEYDEDDEDYTPRPVQVPLTVSIATLNPVQALATATALVNYIAENIGAYAVGEVRSDNYGSTVELNPLAETASWVRCLSNGTVIFDNPVPNADGDIFDTKVAIAGEIDPDNPPREVTPRVQRRIDDFGRGYGRPEIERLVLELTRVDGRDFTEAQLQAPLNMAVLTIAAKFGPITVLETEVGETAATQRVSLQLDGEGELDPRILVNGMAGFSGTIPFPGLGLVRSRLIGGE